MAKLTLGQLSSDKFQKVMKNLLLLKLPITTAFKLKTLTKKFNNELEKFSELRNETLERHCKRDADGAPELDSHKNYTFSDDNFAKVTSEMNALLAIEVGFESIKMSDLGDIAITSDELLTLGDLIDE